jgi:hypothetical protein
MEQIGFGQYWVNQIPCQLSYSPTRARTSAPRTLEWTGTYVSYSRALKELLSNAWDADALG